ncbi:MAG: aminopeptidase [Oligosphaeraceae bacterium]|nr:aminopeptidase [Oligosphaeraceae bacterium]
MADKKVKSDGAELFWRREQGWDKLARGEEKKLERYCAEYIGFLSKAKTERLVHDYMLDLAQKAGFQNLEQVNAEGKKLKPGDQVYRSYGGKTIMLMRVGKKSLSTGLNLVGAHSDCPRLDAKPSPIYQDDDLVLLDTHYYGGIRKYQWVAIPLAIYGVIIKKNGEKVQVAIGDDAQDPVFVITDLLPHLEMEGDKKTLATGIPGEALNVLLGSRPADSKKGEKEVKDRGKLRILNLLKERYDIEEEDFFSSELEIVPAGPARELGLDRSMILGYGHDDRICAYAAAKAILDCKVVPERSQVTLICDKEEIGSYGATGMDSSFLENTVAELFEACGAYCGLNLRRSLERSKMISADVSSLHDPDFAGVSSPNNMARINCGLALTKYTGSRGKSGASEASAEFVAEVRKVFNDNKVHWQSSELGKVDVGGGGTIAHLMARYGMDVIDCGVGLLSMHAPWEVAGKLDTYMAYKGYKAFLEYDF